MTWDEKESNLATISPKEAVIACLLFLCMYPWTSKKWLIFHSVLVISIIKKSNLVIVLIYCNQVAT